MVPGAGAVAEVGAVTQLIEAVARVLQEHMLTSDPEVLPRGAANGCTCGWFDLGHLHSRHVAEVLGEAGLVAPDLPLALSRAQGTRAYRAGVFGVPPDAREFNTLRLVRAAIGLPEEAPGDERV